MFAVGLMTGLKKASKTLLEQSVKKLIKAGFTAETLCDLGNPAEEIMKAASRQRASDRDGAQGCVTFGGTMLVASTGTFPCLSFDGGRAPSGVSGDRSCSQILLNVDVRALGCAVLPQLRS